MSYEVLARKWRPRSFEELVGQEHVRRALANALDQERLHHAYLFTGTRGVGKTTIARIFAKSLNCETNGVTSRPCGTCAACMEIDAGRFIDLIEVDAASRTKVDETRELLENVPYAPTRGRFKVYLIDEVHMFSTHSFNALLKTLEEPPPHVKFLLATTDPQKVPVTILSRCLQFNLKLMPVPAIIEHLEKIAASEGIECEPAALGQLARAASGSMRDALSLLDQAVAHGQGRVTVADVEAMLGTLSRDRLFAILEALVAGDGLALLGEVEDLAQAAADLEPVLADLLALLHQVAVAQSVPDAVDASVADGDRVREIAQRVPPADVQLYYQIATLGRRDLAWAPDPRAGLEMTLLRMLAFRPADRSPENTASDGASARAAPRSRVKAPAAGADSASPKPAAAGEAEPQPATAPVAEPAPAEAPPGLAAAAEPAASATAPSGSGSVAIALDDWNGTVQALGLRGLAGELAANTTVLEFSGSRLRLALTPEHAHLGMDKYRQRLEAALVEHLGGRIRLEIVEQAVDGAETPAERELRMSGERQQAAEREIESDPVVRAMQERFGATVQTDSIRPVESSGHDNHPDAEAK